MQNSLEDIRSLFRFIRPQLFRSTTALSPEIVKRKVEPYFRRKRKHEVYPELPSKIRSDEWLELDSVQQREYSAILAAGQHEFWSGRREFSRLNVFALIQKLKQICNFATGYTESPKLSALLEQIEGIVANQKKAIVFTQFVQAGMNRLIPALDKFGLVAMSGATTAAQRQSLIHRFQTDPDAQVFLATVRTAGEGITLTAGSYVFHFDHWWNPAVAWQAEDRAHRRGQPETVNVYSYWMKGTIEQKIWTILQRKGLLHDEVLGSSSERSIDESLTIDDLLEVIGLDRRQVRLPQGERHIQGSLSRISEVADHLCKLDPYEFERLVMRVFQQSLGYLNARLTSRSSDDGIDIEATKNVDGTLERIVVQCKRMPLVGPGVARELLGVVTANAGTSTGYLVTSGRLSKACRDFCENHSQLRGVDGVQLASWILDSNIAIDKGSIGGG